MLTARVRHPHSLIIAKHAHSPVIAKHPHSLVIARHPHSRHPEAVGRGDPSWRATKLHGLPRCARNDESGSMARMQFCRHREAPTLARHREARTFVRHREAVGRGDPSWRATKLHGLPRCARNDDSPVGRVRCARNDDRPVGRVRCARNDDRPVGRVSCARNDDGPSRWRPRVFVNRCTTRGEFGSRQRRGGWLGALLSASTKIGI